MKKETKNLRNSKEKVNKTIAKKENDTNTNNSLQNKTPNKTPNKNQR